MFPPITMDDVNSVVTLVGGRFFHLSLAAERLQAGDTIDALQDSLFARVKHELHDLQVDLQPPSWHSSVLSNITWSVATALLAAPEHKLAFAHCAAVLQPLQDSSEKEQLMQSNSRRVLLL